MAEIKKKRKMKHIRKNNNFKKLAGKKISELNNKEIQILLEYFAERIGILDENGNIRDAII